MKQRGIFQKVPGSWYVRYADGAGRIRYEKAPSKAGAIQLYRKRKTEVLQGRKLPETLRRAAISFAEIARDALAYSKQHKITYDDDVSRMARLLGWFRDRAADSITPQEIEAKFNEAIEESRWAPSTLNHYRSLLSLTFRLGNRNGKVSSNPARAVPHRREDNSRVRWLTPEEERRLRQVMEAKYPEHIPELDLALHVGLRRSEQYGLVWENVNLAQRVLKIPRSKNGEARYVRLNRTAMAAMQAFLARGNGSGPVIRNLKGEPLAGPRYWFEPAVRDAHLEDFHWHDLTHCFASRLTMAGVNLRSVQEALGHKSIAMTVRYAHLAPDYQLAAVERLDEACRSTDSEGPTEARTETGTASAPRCETARVN